MMRKVLTSLLASTLTMIALSACQTPAMPAPVPERDIKAAMARLQNATILDTKLYTPAVPLKGCETPKKSFIPAPITPKLQAAIAKAKSYSDAQKGIAIVVLRDGNIIHESYADGVDRATLTSSASMMKSVLGLTYGIAIEKGIIKSVDDPAEKYLTEWKGDPRGAITIRQMLNMSSGLESAPFMELLLSSDINAVALRTSMGKEAPGSKFSYNNAVSQLLGIMLNRQLRKNGYRDYRNFLEREFWCPLGNGRAELWIDREGGSPRYYAGMHASIYDWARIGELIRNKGIANRKQIVPSQWIAEMATPSDANPQYGYQLWLGGKWTEKRKYSDANPTAISHSAPFTAKDTVYFDGFGGQRVYVIPSKGITIARTGLTNLAYDDAIIVNAILKGLE